MKPSKNIHILPTDNKYSRLYFNINDKEYQICENEKTSTILKPNRHIYITSNEEIKEGDWFISLYSNSIQRELKLDWTLNKDAYKKIILTTDQDLIKDGAQAIDDDFLEWFVKNPSCEEVEIDKEQYHQFVGMKKIPLIPNYKIIIPKEEPKQHVELINDNIEEFDKSIELFKQETTLEEAAERISPIQQVINFITENFQKEGEPRQLSIDLLKKWCEVKLLNEESKWQQEQDRWKTVSEEIPPSNIELLVESPDGIVHLSSWREYYNIFSCQAKSESSYNWKWKTI